MQGLSEENFETDNRLFVIEGTTSTSVNLKKVVIMLPMWVMGRVIPSPMVSVDFLDRIPHMLNC